MGIGDLYESWRERRQQSMEIRVMIVLAALFCLGVFVTVKELRYIFFGKLAQAQFVETYNETTRGKYGRKTNTPHVRYRFNDEAMVGIMVEDRLESLNNRATAACE